MKERKEASPPSNSTIRRRRELRRKKVPPAGFESAPASDTSLVCDSIILAAKLAMIRLPAYFLAYSIIAAPPSWSRIISCRK